MSGSIVHSEITSISNAAYDDVAYVQLGFTAGWIQIHFVSGNSPIYFSFNGSEDHGLVHDAANELQATTIPIVTNEIWFRGGTGNEVIRYTATPRNS
ncbi:MAG: hypothetical protein KAS32_19695 [Candidatus Peribacteraceae bacterium]|nr:hypothetical protein [Candidatus Peribacteraceae bacterium]